MSAQSLLKIVLATGLVTIAMPAVATVTLAPYLPSSTATTSGANATFVKIANDWKGSNVLWNETAQQYGSGQPISSFGWGTGLWGISDFNRVLSGSVSPVNSWSGLVSTINFGDDCYNGNWSSTWGAAARAPIFTSGSSCGGYTAGQAEGNAQDNWISYFSGYIRITDASTSYNFSVLYDDGFFFNLIGAGGATYSIGRDFLNPRNRLGFGQDFLLSEGLYRFELGAYDRLEAGIVDLRWSQGGSGWQLVPTQNLASIPEPGTLGLLAAGLLAVGLSASRHARGRRVATETHAT